MIKYSCWDGAGRVTVASIGPPITKTIYNNKHNKQQKQNAMTQRITWVAAVPLPPNRRHFRARCHFDTHNGRWRHRDVDHPHVAAQLCYQIDCAADAPPTRSDRFGCDDNGQDRTDGQTDSIPAK